MASAAALTITIWLVAAPTASAHALLVAADPAPGARLLKPPVLASLEFTEPLNHALSGLHLVGPKGQIALSVAFPSTDARRMEARLPVLPPGTYEIVWHTLSQIDGHVRSGTYSFGIEDALGRVPPSSLRPASEPLSPRVPGVLDVLGRWLELLGFTVLLARFLARFLSPRASQGASRISRSGSIAVSLALFLFIVGDLEYVTSAAIASGGADALATFVWRTPAGRWAIVGALTTTTLAAATLVNRRPAPLVAAVAATGTIYGLAATTHEAAGPGAGWGTLIMLLHIGAASIWLGAVGALVWTLVARRRLPAATAEPDIALVLGRLAQLASAAGVAVVASGVLAALIEVPSLAALTSTEYGRLLSLKAVLVAALLAVAAFNALVAAPRRARGTAHAGSLELGRSVSMELVVGAVVLLAAAALSQLAPAGAAVAARATEARIAASDNPSDAVTAMSSLDGSILTLTLAPVEAGPNQVDVDVPVALRGARPTMVRLVDQSGAVRATAALSRTGQDGSEVAFEAFATITPTPGDWTASVVVATPGGERIVQFILPVVAPALGTSATLAAGSEWSSPAPSVPAGIFGSVLLAAVAALVAIGGLVGRPRAHWARRAPLVVGALAGSAVLFGASAAAPTRLAPSPGGWAGPWGVASPAEPTVTSAGREYRVPTAAAGLMNPAIDPEGDLWVSEMNTNKILELDPRAATVRELSLPTPIDLLMGLAIDPIRGRIWFAEEQPGVIGRLDPSSGVIRTYRLPSRIAGPYGVSVAGDGTVWLTEQAADAIASVDPATGAVTQYRIPTPNATPYWLAVAPDGRVWFTELQGGAVGVLDPRTGTIREYRDTATSGQPSGIAIAPDGRVWFARLTGGIGSIDPSSGRISVVATHSVANLYGVAVDASGRVWVGSLEGRILRYDPASSTAVVLDIGPPTAGAWWPAVDGSGTVWVVEESNQANMVMRLART